MTGIVAQSEEIEETVFYLAGHLGETQKKAIRQIRKVTQVLTPDVALDYLKKAQEVERQGGMLIANGSRRRTIGGIFFYLVKTQCSDEQICHIWPDHRNTKPQKKEGVYNAV